MESSLKNEKEGRVSVTNRDLIKKISENLNKNDARSVINLGNGDPTPYPSFQTTLVAEEALLNSLHSNSFNGYPPPFGLPAARRAIAKHLSGDLPHVLLEEDVFITSGASQAIELLLTVLARPGGNILLPRPVFPLYKARAELVGLEVREFDLLPYRDWEADLDAVEALADDETIAMVVINPGYPTGNLFTLDHMQKIAETAQRKGIIVIADEVYRHIVFGNQEFIPMGIFGSLTPVLTVGSLSKRWLIPGWRLGWIAASDPNRLLNKSGIIESIQKYLCMTSSPATLIQGAVAEIVERTPTDFFDKTVKTIRESAEKCYKLINEIPCITCPTKPQGCMFLMMKLKVDMLEGIEDELDFCCKLAKEESVILLPGIGVGLKNWMRVTFAIEPSYIDDAFGRIKAFYLRHAKKTL
ncbi:probable aminotransferase TAT2 [Salvia miltiorrhiza]|uniref:probable aminotransferase TAT2 n=1 Tax=Salvia miltiorrhiza TaxID=226208 RepID=UPI0025ABB942|nr:probable aminotransferase TAT2 [Salvia miltiorrhiza]